MVPTSVHFQSAAVQLCTEQDICLFIPEPGSLLSRCLVPRCPLGSLGSYGPPFLGIWLERWGFCLTVTCQCAPWYCQKELPSGKERGEKKHRFLPCSSEGTLLHASMAGKTSFSQAGVDCYLLGLCRASPWAGSTSVQVWKSEMLGRKQKRGTATLWLAGAPLLNF